MAKTEHDYAVYGIDTDGSERKWCTVSAKSEGHAIKLARAMGPIKQPQAVRLGVPASSTFASRCGR